MPCIKEVVSINCQYCQGKTIKFGKVNAQQRYRCKKCDKVQLANYKNQAYSPLINDNIVALLREGCGIRSIARLLKISPVTVVRRIKAIADAITKPVIVNNHVYEVDELRTFVKSKKQECWVVYALDRQSGQVVDFRFGRRTKANLKKVIDILLIANCEQVYTDGLKIYQELLLSVVHKVNRYGTNKIERMNLTLRTCLKRLNRKTICFSKSAVMLEACLKIYFWHRTTAV